MKLSKIMILLMCIFSFSVANAQHVQSTYSGQESREIKSLSSEPADHRPPLRYQGDTRQSAQVVRTAGRLLSLSARLLAAAPVPAATTFFKFRSLLESGRPRWRVGPAGAHSALPEFQRQCAHRGTLRRAECRQGRRSL